MELQKARATAAADRDHALADDLAAEVAPLAPNAEDPAAPQELDEFGRDRAGTAAAARAASTSV